jgi:hypothetical protein
LPLLTPCKSFSLTAISPTPPASAHSASRLLKVREQLPFAVDLDLVSLQLPSPLPPLSPLPNTRSIAYPSPGVQIRSRPIVRYHHFLGKDDHVLTHGSPSDDLIFAPIIVLYEEGPVSFGWDYHVFQRWSSFRQPWNIGKASPLISFPLTLHVLFPRALEGALLAREQLPLAVHLDLVSLQLACALKRVLAVRALYWGACNWHGQAHPMAATAVRAQLAVEDRRGWRDIKRY